jgi:oligosaccharyltransferase complex subunit alpha (ribophorin I)
VIYILRMTAHSEHAICPSSARYTHRQPHRLKGHLSRLELQQSRYLSKLHHQVLTHLTLQLPAGIRSPYYYDYIGNVTASRFRPTAKYKSTTGRSSAASPFLEIRPRYPFLGGWNYTYTLGWDVFGRFRKV